MFNITLLQKDPATQKEIGNHVELVPFKNFVVPDMFKLEASAHSILETWNEAFDTTKINLTNEGTLIVCNI